MKKRDNSGVQSAKPATRKSNASVVNPGKSVDIAIAEAGSSPSTAVRSYLHFHYASNVIIKKVDQHLSRWGLTVARYSILRLLLNHQVMTLTELSKSHACAAGNITALVDRLERDKLVRRIANDKDRRVTQVALTDKGRAVTKSAIGPHRRFLEKLMAVLKPANIKSLRKAVNALASQAAKLDPV
jgi:DNA-binding MarR family transcriptional regulator